DALIVLFYFFLLLLCSICHLCFRPVGSQKHRPLQAAVEPKPPYSSANTPSPLSGACKRVPCKACSTLTTCAHGTSLLWQPWSTLLLEITSRSFTGATRKSWFLSIRIWLMP
ncbi:hypothetical protein LDENG_00094590, partial [Lucifuga dentata]